MKGFLIFSVVLAVLAFAVGQGPQSNSKSSSTVDEAPKGVADPVLAEEIQKNKANPGSGNPPETEKDPGDGFRYRRQMSVHGFQCREQCVYRQGANLFSCRVRGQKGFFYDYCSPRPNTDRLGKDCTSPCRWHFDPFANNQGYYWCYSKSGSWYGCGPHQ